MNHEPRQPKFKVAVVRSSKNFAQKAACIIRHDLAGFVTELIAALDVRERGPYRHTQRGCISEEVISLDNEAWAPTAVNCKGSPVASNAL